MHRTIQNCSICFLSVGPNNSARSPTHTSETAQFFFWRKWLYAAAGSSLDWLAQKGTRCHFVTCWLQEVFRHPPQCVMEINLFRPKRKVNGETPKSTIKYKSKAIQTHSHGTTAPSRKYFSALFAMDINHLLLTEILTTTPSA